MKRLAPFKAKNSENDDRRQWKRY